MSADRTSSAAYIQELRSALWDADWAIRRLLAGQPVRNADELLATIRRLAEEERGAAV